MFQEYARAHHAFVYDIMLENGDGEVVRSMKGHKITTIYSVSAVDSTMKLYQASLDNGEIYLILKKKTGHNNSMSLVIDGQAYYQSMISGIRLGTNGYVVVKDSRGTILMHRTGNNGELMSYMDAALYPDKDLASLENMIDKQNQGQEGVSEYYSYWWTEPGAPRVKKISAYSPAPMGQDFLVVSAVIDYDDIYIPIAEGFLKLVMVFSGIMGAVLLMVAYMFRLVLQRKKDTEQIAYLTELNRLLEEMHQSEEAIAHQQRLQIMGTMTGASPMNSTTCLRLLWGMRSCLWRTWMRNARDMTVRQKSTKLGKGKRNHTADILPQQENMETAIRTWGGADDEARPENGPVRMPVQCAPGNRPGFQGKVHSRKRNPAEPGHPEYMRQFHSRHRP